ncbi:hypothetical protein KSP35_06845 [Aquihabitans sp. G128]|uniref:hypothetical protein n=1 Tax=Aquihabitans sp. G128 TaxID=2849779 RepID=UPI001C24B111|nr:hypothetical protein [Aquihabitans sp. G128]QXC62512.1 hypothetical protein KSP35_06845 [Aquihabitans sp. G128]
MSAEPTPEEARLQQALRVAADAMPSAPDDWADVLARSAGTHVPLAPVAGGRSGGGARTRAFAVAAAIVLVATVATLVGRSGHDARDGVRATPVDRDTGWYVPVGLPDGWSIGRISTQPGVMACPCEVTAWGDAASGDFLLLSARRSDGDALDAGNVGVDLGGGVTGRGHAGPSGDEYLLEWQQDEVVHAISSRGVPRDDVDELAVRLSQGGAVPDPPVAGWARTYHRAVDGPVDRAGLVTVQLRTPAGHEGQYLLLPTGTGAQQAVGSRPIDRDLAGQPLPVTELRHPVGDDRTGVRYLGEWPGSDAFVASQADGLTDDEARQLVAALRPASTERWRAFLDDAAGHDATLDRAATLADLFTTTHATADTTPRSTPTTTAPSTSATTATTAVTPPDSDPAATGSTTTTPSSRAGMDQLELGSIPADVTVANGEAFTIVLTATNPTDEPIALGGCFPSGATWQLVRDGTPVSSGGYARDCTDQGDVLAPGATRRLLGRSGTGFELHTAEGQDGIGAQLAPGRYEAVFRLTGIDEPVRVPVTITG